LSRYECIDLLFEIATRAARTGRIALAVDTSGIQASFGAGPSTARGGKYRPKPLLPTAQAIECRPTSKRSDKLINITLLGLSLGLRLRQFIITDSRQHRREQRRNHHRHRRYAAPDSVRLETGLL